MNDNDSNITEEDEKSNSEIGATRSGGVEETSAIFTAARKRLKGKSPEKMTQTQFTTTLNDLLDNPEKHGMSEADADRLEMTVVAVSEHMDSRKGKEQAAWWKGLQPHEKLGVIDELFQAGHGTGAEVKAALVKQHGEATKGKEQERPAATPAMAEKMSDWKRWAEAALDEGYLPGNRWEANLLKHLRANNPELVKELEEDGDLEAMVQVQTWQAMKLQETLEAEGTPMEIAQELALQDLFTVQS